MLDDVRILEISAPETMLAGLLLADLGADVVALEPPAGAPGRRIEPFLQEIPGIERSLTWHALNRNKRGITLDPATPDGRWILEELTRRFDAVIESAAPGSPSPLDGIETGDRVIRCTISPFDISGPKSGYAATDLIVVAASGSLAMAGDPDRPPVPLPVPQTMMEAGAEAAVATLAALIARDRDGLGQRAEVSSQIAAMMEAFSQVLVIGAGNPEMPRTIASFAGVRIPSVFPCADGFVAVTIAFGSAWGPMTQRLARWMSEDGHLTSELANVDWSSFFADLLERKASPADLQALITGVHSLCATRTKADLSREARERGLLVAPAMDMRDIAESPQYRERGMWTAVALRPAGRRVDVPARFAQFSNYRIETRRPAPQLSEHTADILQELGLTMTEIQALFVHGII